MCNILPPEAPSSPKSVKVANITTDGATISWKAPKSTGGADITAYIVEMQEGDGEWCKVRTIDRKTLKTKLDDLKEDQSYQIRVFAENSIGRSQVPGSLEDGLKTEKSAKDKPKIEKPAEKPSSPTNVRASDIQTESVSLSWDAPESTGGTPITGYIIEVQEGDGEWKPVKTLDGTSLTATINGLKPGQGYNIRVFAENSVGRSEAPGSLTDKITTKKAASEDCMEIL